MSIAAVQEKQARDLNAAAMQALSRGDLAGARPLLEQALQLDPRNVSLWLNLSAIRRSTGDLAGALDAAEKALKADPLSFMALLMKASLLDRMGKVREAGLAYHNALSAAPAPGALDAATRKAVARAEQVRAEYLAEMENHVRQALGVAEMRPGSAARHRVEVLLGTMVGRRKVYQQEPAQFYYPGLPAIEFYERDEFPWLEQVEAATPSIQEELLSVLRDDDASAEIRPYIAYKEGVPLGQWAELNHNPRWGAYHFFDHGKPIRSRHDRCPKTMAAIRDVPQPAVSGRTPAAMFSILQPRTRIPSHTGVANTRLVTHIPLVVPPDCGFRVGNETRQWQVGEGFVFDDTIEHEVWNDSDQVRVVFIFDVWNPRLSQAERDQVTRVMAALDEFNGAPPETGL